jgi:succinoglycan biosynthesis transport protein ExoP
MSFRQFLLILQARYKIALSVLSAAVVLALIVSLLMPNKYVASTSLVLDVKSPDPIVGMALAGIPIPSYITTQTDIISSDRVAQAVVKLLKLDENPQIREQWRKATDGKGQLEVWLGNLLAKKLEVKPSRDSDVITLSYSAEDPAFAATVANAFAQAYINTNLELKVEPARESAQWFQTRVADLRKDLESAQARLAAFQKKTGIVPASGRVERLENSKIAELSGQLVLAESQAAELRSKKNHLRDEDTLAEVMQNPIIVSLKEQLNMEEAKLEEASRNLGQNNPEYQAKENEIATLKQKLDAETQRILSSINTANSVNRTKLSELQATIAAHKQEAIENSAEQDQIAVLENDVESAQKSYDFVVQRYTESNLQSQASQTNISVLTPATAPTTRSSPNMFKNLLIAVFVGTILGVGAAFVAEMLDQRVRTAESLGAATGIPTLVQLKKDVGPLRIKGWRMKLSAFKLKLRFRKAAATA